MPANKIKFTDGLVRNLPLAASGSYIARDSELSNFFVLVGKRRRSYCVQQDVRVAERRKTVRVRIGLADLISASEARARARRTLGSIEDQKILSASDKRAVDRGEDPTGSPRPEITLGEAWERYKVAMERKDRSARTITGYQIHIDAYFADWKKLPLRKLANDPDMVAAATMN